MLVPASRVPGGMRHVNQQDLDYYLSRIAAEEIAAQRAAHPAAAESHRRLAEEYASLIVANLPDALCRAA
jgi:lipid-binding SYLF domain-containing protein